MTWRRSSHYLHLFVAWDMESGSLTPSDDKQRRNRGQSLGMACSEPEGDIGYYEYPRVTSSCSTRTASKGRDTVLKEQEQTQRTVCKKLTMRVAKLVIQAIKMSLV